MVKDSEILIESKKFTNKKLPSNWVMKPENNYQFKLIEFPANLEIGHSAFSYKEFNLITCFGDFTNFTIYGVYVPLSPYDRDLLGSQSTAAFNHCWRHGLFWSIYKALYNSRL